MSKSIKSSKSRSRSISISKSKSLDVITDILAGEKRVAERLLDPLTKIINLFGNLEILNKKIAEHREMMKQMLLNPVNFYKDFKNRIILKGETAEFPEFAGVVSFLLIKILHDAGVNAACQSNPSLDIMRTILLHEIISIQVVGRMVYPYKATILVIEQMLKFIDVYYRGSTNDKYAPLYHNFRYRMYLPYMLSTAPENIIFPTIRQLGSTDLIKIRCVPIMLLGVVSAPVHADQYKNTPLDFWAHDLQHVRRQYQETERYYDIVVKHIKYYDARSPFDFVSKITFYEKMENYTQSVLLPIFESKDGDNDYNKALKQWIRMLIFEIVHEKAWPITKFSLLRNIPLGYDVFPIEKLDVTADTIITKDEAFNDPTTLSNLYKKMRRGFYDSEIGNDSEINKILLKKFRTAKYLKDAVNLLIRKLNMCAGVDDSRTECRPFEDETLFALILDSQNADEFDEHPELQETETQPDIKQYKNKNKAAVAWKIELGAPSKFIELGGGNLTK